MRAPCIDDDDDDVHVLSLVRFGAALLQLKLPRLGVCLLVVCLVLAGKVCGTIPKVCMVELFRS